MTLKLKGYKVGGIFTPSSALGEKGWERNIKQRQRDIGIAEYFGEKY